MVMGVDSFRQNGYLRRRRYATERHRGLHLRATVSIETIGFVACWRTQFITPGFGTYTKFRTLPIVAALELQSVDDLLPCPASFPKIGNVVKRRQLSDVLKLVPTLTKPLLIHANGGLGKTVFLQSLSSVLADTHRTTMFD